MARQVNAEGALVKGKGGEDEEGDGEYDEDDDMDEHGVIIVDSSDEEDLCDVVARADAHLRRQP